MDYKILLIVILCLTQLLTITVKALVNRNKPKPEKPNPNYSGDIQECKDAILRIEKEQKKHGERIAKLEQATVDLTRALNRKK